MARAPWTIQEQIYREVATFTRGVGSIARDVGKWAYHAVTSQNKRATPTGILRSEDAELNRAERAKLVSGARDLRRNFTLIGWMVRKHMDYVSTFTFQAKGTDDVKNAKIEAFVAKWSKKENFDIAKRHTLSRFIRLAEQRRVIDGDVFILKLSNGRVQAIEGDRIAMPFGGIPAAEILGEVIHGVVVDGPGAATAYVLCKRTGGTPFGQGGSGLAFEDLLDADDVFHHAYWDGFDQTRGISPLAGAYNSATDLYEGFDYALAKLKVSQLLSLVVYREAAESMGDVREDSSDPDAPPKYSVPFGKAPFKMELDPGDRAEFLESKSPSIEFQQFTESMVSLVLKGLDLPYSFFDESFSNYSGSRQALLQYEQSAENRRQENRDLLDDLTAWRLKMAIEAEDPDLEGITLDDLRWEWVSSALPWIDPMKEVSANSAAVDRGFTSTPRVCKEQGFDAFEVAKEQADHELKVRNYRVSIGLPPVVASNPVTYTEIVAGQDSSKANAA